MHKNTAGLVVVPPCYYSERERRERHNSHKVMTVEVTCLVFVTDTLPDMAAGKGPLLFFRIFFYHFSCFYNGITIITSFSCFLKL